MTAPAPWAYGADKDGKFYGVCAADAEDATKREWLLSMAGTGATIHPLASREEYLAWLEPLKP